jgi:Carbohydrate-selective porin, OprB family
MGPPFYHPHHAAARSAFGRPALLGLATALALAVADASSPAWARSVGHASGHHADETLDPLEPDDTGTDTAAAPDDPYGAYLAFKRQLKDEIHFEYSVVTTVLPQWGSPKGGPGVANFITSPNVAWRAFSDPTIGTGFFNVSLLKYQFWTGQDSDAQATRLGINTPSSDWNSNGHEYSQFTYTHRFPGDWLSATFGQYTFGGFDANRYGTDAQLYFVNDALTQNASQTYANAGLGAYAEARLADKQLLLATGFQGATDVLGDTVTDRGYRTGKYAYFASAQWSPSFLPGSKLGILWYTQPAVPEFPSRSEGISINAAQNIGTDWSVFLRANQASGTDNTIESSIGVGLIRNNLFQRGKEDQAGIGIFWDKTNMGAAALMPPEEAFGVSDPLYPVIRGAEWGTEIYYRFSVFKGLQVTPDVQLFFNSTFGGGPTQQSGTVAIFAVRSTLFF